VYVDILQDDAESLDIIEEDATSTLIIVDGDGIR
jgi:hypothetical protein